MLFKICVEQTNNILYFDLLHNQETHLIFESNFQIPDLSLPSLFRTPNSLNFFVVLSAVLCVIERIAAISAWVIDGLFLISLITSD